MAQSRARDLGAVLEDLEDEQWAPEDRRKLLELLSKDERSAVRLAVVEALVSGQDFTESDETMLRELAADDDPVVRRKAAMALGFALERQGAAHRLATLADWSLDGEQRVRIAVARVLDGALFVPAADSILAHLVRDPEPAVRYRALRASASRFSHDPGLVSQIAQQALQDDDRKVRQLARRLAG